MHMSSFRMGFARVATTTVLSASLLMSTMPVLPVYADLETDLANAQAQLEALGEEYAQLIDDLDESARELEIIQGEIEETKDKLAQSQALLASNMADTYKMGGGQMVEVVLGASSFDDLMSRVFYANKVSEAQADAIEQVQELKAELEASKKQQEREMEQTEAKIEEVKANQEEAQTLVNSLSAEMREQLEAEARRNEELAAGMQAAEDASQEGDDFVATDTDASNTESQPSDDNDDSDSSSSNRPSGGTSTVGGSALSYALSQEGVADVMGGASPSEGFDCSGLVMWAYAQIGVSLPHGASWQAEYIQQHGRWITDMSQLQYGDLVFYSGHVAFYVGNGQVFGAWRPGRPAGYGDLYACGTPYGAGNI